MRSIVLLIVCFLFLNCTKSYFSDHFSVDNAWNKKTAAEFTFDIINDKIPYDLNIVLRNNNEYPYRNIYFFTELNGIKDTIQYELAEKDGYWKGTGMGETKETYFSFKQKFLFPKIGKQTLKIYQGMRKDTLKGIEDISLIVNESK